MKKEITQELLKELFHYDPLTGLFTRIKDKGRAKIGDIAGYKTKKEYTGIKVFGKSYQAHRLAWLYVYGIFPSEEIDHINGIRDDNRLCNLREATASQNACNTIIRNDNKSGFKGVHWHKQSSRWRASIQLNGKPEHIGSFKTKEDAHEAYKQRSLELHKEFARS